MSFIGLFQLIFVPYLLLACYSPILGRKGRGESLLWLTMIYDSWTKWRNYKRNKPLKVTNMATSKMKIKKVCEWCGTTFYAQKLTTRFCSHRCNNLAYKEAVRQKRIQEIETKVQTVISEQPISYFLCQQIYYAKWLKLNRSYKSNYKNIIIYFFT